MSNSLDVIIFFLRRKINTISEMFFDFISINSNFGIELEIRIVKNMIIILRLNLGPDGFELILSD